MTHSIISLAAPTPPRRSAWLLAVMISLVSVACGGGGGGGVTATPAPMLGDDARRAVLADIGSDVILPSIRDFETKVAAMAVAVADYAADVNAPTRRVDAQVAWREAMLAFQRLEVMQLGPLAPTTAPGGQDLRPLIYAYPQRNQFEIDCRALNGAVVDAQARIDAIGLGALEQLLFAPINTTAAQSGDCGPVADQDQARADYAQAVAEFTALQAAALRSAWEPGDGNFVGAFSQAGAGSPIFSTPQAALNALSEALFFVELEAEDRKIAVPAGIQLSNDRIVNCPSVSCPERVELPFSGDSTAVLRANVLAFRDLFSGLDDGMGLNDLLRGIDRADLADRVLSQLDASLSHIDQEIDPDFAAEVALITDQTACTNADSSGQGEPAACALHGILNRAMTTFRVEIVGALNLATPMRAAGDND